MLTKQIYALLAMGGELRADRTFPHPHHYTAHLAGLTAVELTTEDVIDLTTEDVIDLLATKRIEAPPAREIGDHYRYRVIDPVWVKGQALHGYERGFGRCAQCGVFPLALDTKYVAPRHGHTKAQPTPCIGSGKPMMHVVSREPLPVGIAA
jgi:hypothetical protein